MTPDRLAELRSKVEHGYNLINSEAREVFEHFGYKVPQRKRCRKCDGIGYVDGGYVCDCIPCLTCDGTGYEVKR